MVGVVRSVYVGLLSSVVVALPTDDVPNRLTKTEPGIMNAPGQPRNVRHSTNLDSQEDSTDQENQGAQCGCDCNVNKAETRNAAVKATEPFQELDAACHRLWAGNTWCHTAATDVCSWKDWDTPTKARVRAATSLSNMTSTDSDCLDECTSKWGGDWATRKCGWPTCSGCDQCGESTEPNEGCGCPCQHDKALVAMRELQQTDAWSQLRTTCNDLVAGSSGSTYCDAPEYCSWAAFAMPPVAPPAAPPSAP